MDVALLSQINFMAVIISAIIFFVIGSIWFSFIFRDMWVRELAHHNVIIKEPSAHTIMMNMILTFVQNIIVSFAIAYLVVMTNSTTMISGLYLGLIAGCGFSAAAIGGVFIWEGRSLRLFFIDAGYQVLGVVTAAIILSLWR